MENNSNFHTDVRVYCEATSPQYNLKEEGGRWKPEGLGRGEDSVCLGGHFSEINQYFPPTPNSNQMAGLVCVPINPINDFKDLLPIILDTWDNENNGATLLVGTFGVPGLICERLYSLGATGPRRELTVPAAPYGGVEVGCRGAGGRALLALCKRLCPQQTTSLKQVAASKPSGCSHGFPGHVFSLWNPPG